MWSCEGITIRNRPAGVLGMASSGLAGFREGGFHRRGFRNGDVGKDGRRSLVRHFYFFVFQVGSFGGDYFTIGRRDYFRSLVAQQCGRDEDGVRCRSMSFHAVVIFRSARFHVGCTLMPSAVAWVSVWGLL